LAHPRHSGPGVADHPGTGWGSAPGGDPMALIAALLRDRQDRAVVAEAAGGERQVLFCAHANQLAIAAARGGLRGIILEWSGPVVEVEPVLQALNGLTDRPSLVVYGRLTAAWARDLLALAKSGLDVQAVLQGFENLGAAVRALRASPRE